MPKAANMNQPGNALKQYPDAWPQQAVARRKYPDEFCYDADREHMKEAD